MRPTSHNGRADPRFLPHHQQHVTQPSGRHDLDPRNRRGPRPRRQCSGLRRYSAGVGAPPMVRSATASVDAVRPAATASAKPSGRIVARLASSAAVSPLPSAAGADRRPGTRLRDDPFARGPAVPQTGPERPQILVGRILDPIDAVCRSEAPQRRRLSQQRPQQANAGFRAAPTCRRGHASGCRAARASPVSRSGRRAWWPSSRCRMPASAQASSAPRTRRPGPFGQAGPCGRP